MARRARVVLPDRPHHITQRGNGSQSVFLTATDKEIYLRLLGDHARRAGLRVIAYCLMTNHVHLIAVPERVGSLAKGLGRTHNDYARWFHVRERRTGHLWQNRFFSCPLAGTHLADALRYVELNPVRAGLAKTAWDWNWSSARARIDGRDACGILHPSIFASDYLGETWRRVLEAGWRDTSLALRIREATQTGRPFGDPPFVESAEQETGRVLSTQKRGRKSREQIQAA